MELPKDGGEGKGDANDNDNNEGETTGKEEGRGYRYRDAPGASIIDFPPTVRKLKLLAEEWYNSRNQTNAEDNAADNDNDAPTSPTKPPVKFNVCLLNYYQNGTQRIGWHSDREEPGRSTPIASISLGVPRQFLIRSKTDGIKDRSSLTM